MSKASFRLQAKVTKLYVDMRLRRISKLDWMIETEKTIETLRQLEPDDILSKLFYAQLLITKEAYAVADEMLRGVEAWLKVNSSKEPAYHAYYLYLTTLMRDDEIYDARVTQKLYELAGKHQDIWQIQWLIYYLDRNLANDYAKQYHFLKRMFIQGCRSPLMYSEARILLERNPAFLYEFSEFEVQLMVFMIRHTKMSSRVCDILADFMLKRTDYRYLYWIILCGCYETNPSEQVLKNICRMMVLGGCVGKKFDGWYRKGIAEDVRVQGLYEAFMKSLSIENWEMDGEELSDERKIPQEVLEYFAHSSELDEVRTAYLYALVHKYKDNWFSIYRLYEPLIVPFMQSQLYKGQINVGLSYLYEHLLKASELPKEHIETFLDICYSYKISNLPIEHGMLIVSYQNIDAQVQIPFSAYEAVVPVYGEAVDITVQNHSGNLFTVSEAQITPMINKSLWAEFFKGQDITNMLYHLSIVESALTKGNLEMHLDSAKYVLFHEDVSQTFKEEVAKRVLSYWDVNGAYDDIVEVAPYVFCENGMYSKNKETAFWRQQYLQNYIGIYGMQFLVDHYAGSLQEQTSIFMKARAMGVAMGNYAEGILLEMMQYGQLIAQHQEVLEDYVASTTKNLEVLRAYLDFVAKEYYLAEKYLENKYLHIQAFFAKQGMEFELMTRLAYLQGLVNMGIGNVSQELAEIAIAYIEGLLQKNIYFTWMQPLKAICPKLISKEPYQVLEYKGNVEGPIWMRFTRYGLKNQEADAFQSEVLEPICDALYAKSFLLYYGERMHYEIFCLDGTEHKLLKQGILQRGQDLADESNTRYSKLNQLLRLREEGKHKELFGQLEKYYSESAMVEQLFTLK